MELRIKVGNTFVLFIAYSSSPETEIYDSLGRPPFILLRAYFVNLYFFLINIHIGTYLSNIKL